MKYRCLGCCSRLHWHHGHPKRDRAVVIHWLIVLIVHIVFVLFRLRRPVDGAGAVAQTKLDHFLHIIGIRKMICNPVCSNAHRAIAVQSNHAKRSLKKVIVHRIVRLSAYIVNGKS